MKEVCEFCCAMPSRVKVPIKMTCAEHLLRLKVCFKLRSDKSSVPNAPERMESTRHTGPIQHQREIVWR